MLKHKRNSSVSFVMLTLSTSLFMGQARASDSDFSDENSQPLQSSISYVSQEDYARLQEENARLRREIQTQKKARSHEMGVKIGVMKRLKDAYVCVQDVTSANETISLKFQEVAAELQLAQDEVDLLKVQHTVALAQLTRAYRERALLERTLPFSFGVSAYFLMWLHRSPIDYTEKEASTDMATSPSKQEPVSAIVVSPSRKSQKPKRRVGLKINMKYKPDGFLFGDITNQENRSSIAN